MLVFCVVYVWFLFINWKISTNRKNNRPSYIFNWTQLRSIIVHYSFILTVQWLNISHKGVSKRKQYFLRKGNQKGSRWYKFSFFAFLRMTQWAQQSYTWLFLMCTTWNELIKQKLKCKRFQHLFCESQMQNHDSWVHIQIR